MKVISHNCPTCSAGLAYDVDTQNWTCDFCKKAFTIKELMEYHNNKKYNETTNMHGYCCDNCGAEIVTCDDNISSICIYCGSPVIIKERIEGEYKPDLIAPFKHTKEDIIKEFLKLKEERGLVPENFFDTKNITRVHGVYIPLFVVTCEVSASLRGDGFVNKDYRSTFFRKGTMQLKDVPADAKSSIDDRYISALEPFEYDKFKKFEYPYLAGMSAETYDRSKEEVYEQEIMEKIEAAAYEKILKFGRRYIRYEIVSKDVNTFCSEFKHALVPIWCIHVQYRGKEYVYYVNDQNFKVAGTYPIDKVKEMLFLIVMIFLNFVVLSGSLLFNKPISYFIAIGGTLLIWYIYSNVINSYTVLRVGKKNKEYISDGSFLPIASEDNEYRVR